MKRRRRVGELRQTESLEQRLALTCGPVSLPVGVPTCSLSGGQLTVNGTNGNDELYVHGVFDAAGELRLVPDFDEHPPAVADTSYPLADDVTRIEVHLLGGDDTFIRGNYPSTTEIEAFGGPGNDLMLSDDGTDTLWGGPGYDMLHGGASGGSNRLYGGADNDLIRGGAGGDDIIHGDDPNDPSVTGHDWIAGGGHDGAGSISHGIPDQLQGGPGNDFIVSKRYNSPGISETIIHGNSGRDFLLGGSGNDTIEGGDDQDTVQGGLGADSLLRGGKDSDTVIGDAAGQNGLTILSFPTLHMNEANRSSMVNFLMGFSGYLVSSTQGPTLTIAQNGPGHGSDTIYGDDGDDLLYGQGGADTLYGGNDNDIVLDGGDGGDYLHGNSGNDYLYGRDGNDTLYAGQGTDHLRGGDGNDHLTGIAAPNVENFLYGDDGADTLLGYSTGSGQSPGRFYMEGGDGNDFLQGDAGNDRLYGLAGEDNLYGKAGDDLLDGGSNDLSAAARNVNGVMVYGDFLHGGDDTDQLYGRSGRDYLYSGSGTNEWLAGGSQDDTLVGVGGDDDVKYLKGEHGNDELSGISTADESQGETHARFYLDGGTGNDTLTAGDGVDTLVGGAGADHLFYHFGVDTLFTDEFDTLFDL